VSCARFHAGETLGEIPAHLLTDEAPRYPVEPAARAPLAPTPDPRPGLPELLASPNVRSRAWIYERYDHLVGSRTVRRPGLDAAVLRLRPSMRGLAVSWTALHRTLRGAPAPRGRAGRCWRRRATSRAPAGSRSA
jgi:phosphoribosylformylglycinamidine synthase